MVDFLFWLVGIVGAVAFAFNLAPQVYKCYKEKSATQISVGFLVLAFLGNICYGLYLVHMNWNESVWKLVPIYFNYGTALTLTTVLAVMKKLYSK